MSPQWPRNDHSEVQIEKTKENFRLLYNTKGRFVLHKVAKEEAGYKLCRVKRVTRGPRGTPYAVTHDGRTIRFPDPDVKDEKRAMSWSGSESMSCDEDVLATPPTHFEMNISLRMPSGKAIPLRVDSHGRTDFIMQQALQQIPGGHNRFPQLILNGKMLGSCACISACGITEGSELNLFLCHDPPNGPGDMEGAPQCFGCPVCDESDEQSPSSDITMHC
ncbi:RpS4 [Symbiodinium natans]|uniref:RpS4 protein n=1 Tax=Symbiodinium natans TaxID=878477 RepID=A0A812JMW3_9DINO|nr:RpS4 [Symbiodinium natans]